MYEGDETNFDADPPEENNNRTFIFIAGGLGLVVLLSIVCLAVYALVILPRNRETAAVALDAQNTQVAEMNRALTATVQAAIVPTMTFTPLPSPTPVLAQLEPSATPLPPTADPATATVAVALTQVANAAQNPVTPIAPGDMPKSGIADEYGIPGLLAATLILVIVIVVARRMRSAPVRNR
jgi:hypothetical protein